MKKRPEVKAKKKGFIGRQKQDKKTDTPAVEKKVAAQQATAETATKKINIIK